MIVCSEPSSPALRSPPIDLPLPHRRSGTNLSSALICQDPAYKKMSSDDVLGRIINHEMNIQEANNIKNLYKGISTSKKQDIALQAKKSKKKKVLIETPSEEEEKEEEEENNEREYDEDEVALFIKKFNKFIKRRRSYKGERKEKSRSKRVCHNCSKNDHFITQCPHERKEEDITRERSLTKATRKTRNILRRSLMVKLLLVKNGTQVMKVLNQKVMTWQP
jgi:hypothetical protein